MSETAADAATEAFVAHRNLLFTVAYEMLGSAADAEDVLQETWLRWSSVDLDEVRDQRAYLVRITTRLALNRIRSLSRRKETYVGPWLPEPLLTSPDVAEDVELADSLSTAMLLVLETLSPTERAVFVLREVFDVPYDDIAAAVDKTPAAVRQIAHRARGHVAEQRPREVVSAAEVRRVLELFREAALGGDIQAFMDVLAPDAVVYADGGGVVQASRNPIYGAEKIIRFLSGVAAKFIPQLGPITMEQVTVNGSPALLTKLGGEVDGTFTVRVEDGLVTALYYVRNPAKLGRLGRPEELTRG